MKRRGYPAAAALTAVTVLVLVMSPAIPAQGHRRHRGVTIAPGVTLRQLKISGPNRVKVLTIDPAQAASMDVALAGNDLGGWAKTSSMATAHNALAAVNGDFGLDPGRPAHLFAMDGDLVQTTVLGNQGKNFAISQDEQHLYLDAPHPVITVQSLPGGTPITVDRWNQGGVVGSQISGYTAVGGSVEQPPRNACSARLVSPSKYAWGPNQMGVARDFTVDAVNCQTSPTSLGGGLVLAAARSGAGAAAIQSLPVGSSVRLTWSLGWAGVLDSIGGNPMLLQNGKLTVSACGSYLCQLQPRTAIGVTAKGRIILMVVDGRQPGYSIGMTLVQEAQEMKALGAVNALNLDGGGSSTMWIRGRGVINRPSDGSERSVTSALLVLPGSDPGDPNIARPVVGTSVPTTLDPDPAAAAEASLMDPGSTGGLLDSLAPSILSPHLRQERRAFRSSVG